MLACLFNVDALFCCLYTMHHYHLPYIQMPLMWFKKKGKLNNHQLQSGSGSSSVCRELQVSWLTNAFTAAVCINTSELSVVIYALCMCVCMCSLCFWSWQRGLGTLGWVLVWQADGQLRLDPPWWTEIKKKKSYWNGHLSKTCYCCCTWVLIYILICCQEGKGQLNVMGQKCEWLSK